MLLDRPIRKVPGDLPRKWLFDDLIELVVWYTNDQTIYGFQIIYDLQDHSKALTYHPKNGFSHHIIDSGEHNPSLNYTPVLETESQYNISEIACLFESHASKLPDDIKEF